MVYPQQWSSISCRSGTGQGKFVGSRTTFYHCATQPTKRGEANRCKLYSPESDAGDPRAVRQRQVHEARAVVSHSDQRVVTDVARVVEAKSRQTAVATVLTTAPRQAVVRHRAVTQLDAAEARKQHGQPLQRLVVDVAQAATAPAPSPVHHHARRTV